MGVDYQGLRLLLFAARAGVSFKKPVMLGRQNFADLTAQDVSSLLKKFNWPADVPTVESLLARKYIEPLLEFLGAQDTASMDASSYEGAGFVHDLNLPLPDQMKNRYSLTLDFGTLEHVFNYPQALKNAMETVALGGHFLIVTACNGFTGHGFYQISPEMFFRALSPENGFEVEHQFICEVSKGGDWYRCVDPKLLKRRAEVVTDCPTYLLVQARRTAISQIFSTPPQQSDYVSIWTGDDMQIPPVPNTMSWRGFVPRPIKRAARRLLNSSAYRKGLKINDLAAFVPFRPEGTTRT